MFKKYVILAIAFFMLTSLVMLPLVKATGSGTNPPNQPGNTNYGTWIVDEGAGAFPATVDPANCYDTASAEVLFNSVETLLFFMGENPDKFEPLLATQATVAPADPAAPLYTNFTVYFKIRGTQPNGDGTIPFQNRCRTDFPVSWGQYFLTTKDVVFSFQRFLVHDYVGAATWMFYEFLLDCHVADPNNIGAAWGTYIQNAIQSNNTYVWLNIANPGLVNRAAATSFTPVSMFTNDYGNGTFDPNFYTSCAGLPLDYPLRILFQVIAQEWCGIISQQWVIHYINTNLPAHAGALLADWDGTTYADWKTYTGWDSSDAPADKLPIAAATPGVMCGTGPYVLDRYDASAGWSIVAYDWYWQGWWWLGASWYPLYPWSPLINPYWLPFPPTWPPPGLYPPYWPWPVLPEISCPYPPEPDSGIVRGGYITRLIVVNTRNTAGRIADLISGAVDTSAINRANAYKVHYPGTANGDRNGPTQDGIRLNYPIPTLQTESQHYTFYIEIAPGNPYNVNTGNDTLAVGGIPQNFFNNTHVRLAFTYLWNFTYCITTLMFGEAYQPVTCAPNGLPYVNPIQTHYSDSPTNEAAAKAELDLAVFGGVHLNTVGFTVNLCYYDAAGGVRENSVLALQAAVNKLGTDYGLPYHASVTNIPWASFIPAINNHWLPTFRVGWLADYVDIQDFLFPYGASQGDYGKAQNIGIYTDNNLTHGIDLDLKEAARVPDGALRQSLYYDAEAKLYTLNPTVFILVPIGRGYQRTWDQGFAVEYNALMPGIYAYKLWKWIYIRGDVDYNCKVNMGDIVIILAAFGSYIGKSGMPVIHARWNFHADIDGNPYESGPLGGDGGWRDRKIDMYDVSAALADFGKFQVDNWEIHLFIVLVSITLTVTITGGNPATRAIQWFKNGIMIPGATTNSYVTTGSGTYDCFVSDGVQQQKIRYVIP
jgi:hypothetical protein